MFCTEFCCSSSCSPRLCPEPLSWLSALYCFPHPWGFNSLQPFLPGELWPRCVQPCPLRVGSIFISMSSLPGSAEQGSTPRASCSAAPTVCPCSRQLSTPHSLIYSFIDLFVYLFIDLFVYLFVCLFIDLSSSLWLFASQVLLSVAVSCSWLLSLSIFLQCPSLECPLQFPWIGPPLVTLKDMLRSSSSNHYPK